MIGVKIYLKKILHRKNGLYSPFISGSNAMRVRLQLKFDIGLIFHYKGRC